MSFNVFIPWGAVSVKDSLKKMEKILYICASLLALMIALLSFFHVAVPQKESYLAFYADSIVSDSENWIAYIFAFLCFGGLVFTFLGWMKTENGPVKERWKSFAEDLGRKTSRLPKAVFDLFKLTFPILLNLILFSYVVGYVNAINRHRLIDSKLASVDFWLTGTYPFLKLETIRFPAWLIEAVEFSFSNLTVFLVLAAVITYLKNKTAFSKYAVAFFASILMMVPIWLAVPVMSPQDRFIDNVYHIKDPPRIASELRHFSPVPQVQTFLEEMRRSKEGLDVMPTTTFPSSHAAWATIAFIFLLEASGAASIFFAPFLILSTLGTFYLAQHYFVDTPAGILIGIISAVFVSFLFREKTGGKYFGAL